MVDPEGAKAAFQPAADENERPTTPPEIAKCVPLFRRVSSDQSRARFTDRPDEPSLKPHVSLTRLKKRHRSSASFCRRFRKSALHRPGRKVLHPGFADDPSVDHLVHGARTVPSEPVGDVLASQYPTNPVLRFQRERAEATYASTAREPLGRSYVRGHLLPEGLGAEKGFGVVSAVEPTSSVVKDVVFPPKEGEMASTLLLGDAVGSDAHALYVKSHGNYAPGEPRRRGYDWNAAGVDPETATFGISTRAGGIDAIEALKHDPSAPALTVEQSINPLKDATRRDAVGARIVDARSEAHRAAAADALGRSKPLGTGIEVDPSAVHGAPSRTRDENGELEWDAGRVMRGEYSESDQAPDPSIGKSTTRQGDAFDPDPPHARDADCAFGVPSTRRDLAPPSRRSVADETAYGDEATAAALVNPGYGAERGVTEGDYGEAMREAEMRRFYEDAGVADPDADDGGFFAAAFAAAAAEDSASGRVQSGDSATLGTFQRARVRMMASAIDSGR